MCRVDSCCGCCSLETGTIVQGSLDILWAALVLIMAVVSWRMYLYTEDETSNIGVAVCWWSYFFAVMFFTFAGGLLVRAAVVMGGAFCKSAPVVMVGVIITVVQLAANVGVSICLFLFHSILFGLVTILFTPITVYCLITLISYFLELRDGGATRPGGGYQAPGYVWGQPPGAGGAPVYPYAAGGNYPVYRGPPPAGPSHVVAGASPSTHMGLSREPGTPFPPGIPPGYPMGPSREPGTPFPPGTPPGYPTGPSWEPGTPFLPGTPPGYPTGPSREPETLFPPGTPTEYPTGPSWEPEPQLPSGTPPGSPIDPSREPGTPLPPLGTPPGYAMGPSREPGTPLLTRAPPGFPMSSPQDPATRIPREAPQRYPMGPQRTPPDANP